MKLSNTAYVILGALSIQSGLSGYDIRKGVEQSVGHFWGESYGQIYPALKRLSELGLIESAAPTQEPEPSAGGRPRRQAWAITAAGRLELRQWLARPFHNEPIRNEFLLKLFFCGEAAPGVALAHVQELQARNQRSLAMMKGMKAMAASQPNPNPNLPYWMLTLELGMRMTEAALAWGEETTQALPELERKAHGAEEPRRTQGEP
jgi:DNA-binding PadR family transcriptional regulator